MNSIKNFITYGIQLLFVLTLGPSCVGQDFQFVQYTTEDGLPSDHIYDICLDHHGYIWIATDYGICRYDGRNFKSFTKKEGLTDNEVFGFFVDSKARIWYKTFNGQMGYIENGFLANPKNTEFLRSLYFEDVVMAIAEDNEGRIWAQSNSGKIFTLDNQNKIDSFQVSPREHLVTNNLGKIVLVSPHSFPSGQVKIMPNQESKEFVFKTFSKEQTKNLVRINDDWIPELYKTLYDIDYDLDDDVLIHQHGDDYWLYSPNHPLVLASKEGRRLKKGKEFEIVKAAQALHDHEGNIWFASSGQGLFKYKPNLIGVYKRNQELPDVNLTDIHKEGDVVHISTSQGSLIAIDEKGIKESKLDPEWGGVGQQNLRIRNIDVHNDEFYIGMDNVLYIYDLQLHTPKQQFLFSFKDLFFGTKSFYTATAAGVLEFTYSKPSEKSSIFSKRATSVLESSEGKVWVGTNKGIYQVFPNAEIKQFAPNLTAQFLINDIGETRSGHILFATNGDGLVIKEKDTSRIIGESAGLASNVVRQILIDASDGVWLSTNKGISSLRFQNSGEYFIKNYTYRDGLVSNDVISSYIENGKLYALSSDGLAIIGLSGLERAEEAQLRLLFDGMFVNDGKRSLEDLKELNHNENEVRFEFSSVSINHGPNVEYHYRLLGHKDVWGMTRNNKVSYSGLAPGHYTFEIYPQYSFKKEEEAQVETTRIELIIGQVWYKRTLFRWGLALLVFLFMYFMLRYRFALERKKNVDQLKLAELKQRALLTQMNPHFINNSLSAIQNYVLAGDKRQASNYLSRFADLIRIVLNNSKESRISIAEEIRHLELYLNLEQLRFQKKFDFSIQLSDEVNMGKYFIPTMLIQPLIENSVVHAFDFSKSDANIINVVFSKKENYIVCEVSDNGMGITASKERSRKKVHSSGIAVGNIIERIALLKNSYPKSSFDIMENLDDGKVNGSCSTLIIPILENE